MNTLSLSWVFFCFKEKKKKKEEEEVNPSHYVFEVWNP